MIQRVAELKLFIVTLYLKMKRIFDRPVPRERQKITVTNNTLGTDQFGV